MTGEIPDLQVQMLNGGLSRAHRILIHAVKEILNHVFYELDVRSIQDIWSAVADIRWGGRPGMRRPGPVSPRQRLLPLGASRNDGRCQDGRVVLVAPRSSRVGCCGRIATSMIRH